jgi:hypothetical protein
MISHRRADLLDQAISQTTDLEQEAVKHAASDSGDEADIAELVTVARKIRSVAHPRLSQSAKDAGLRTVISSAMAQRQPGYKPISRKASRVYPRLRQTAIASTLIVALLSVTVGTVFAAEQSLPGDVLYSIKITREHVTVSLAPAKSETAMLLWIVERRTNEVEQLVAAEREIPASTLEALQNATLVAVTAITSDETRSTDDVQRLAAICNREIQALDQISGLTSPGAQANLQEAKSTSEDALSIANEILQPETETDIEDDNGYPVVPPGQEKKQEDTDWVIPPGLEDKGGTPPGQQDRNEMPPGQEKKEATPTAVPSGEEVQEETEEEVEVEEEEDKIPPGQEKKDEDTTDVPPGLEDKGGEPPGQQDNDHSPPGQEDKDKDK